MGVHESPQHAAWCVLLDAARMLLGRGVVKRAKEELITVAKAIN